MKSEHRKMIPVMEPDLSQLEEDYLLESMRSGWISSIGTFIGKFEEGFADFCDVSYAVSVSNGTCALHLALAAAGVGPGDEVIIPSLTFIATAAAVRHSGATPVFADCEKDIGTIAPAAVANAVTNKTKAVICVHLYGHPVDMDQIQAIVSDTGVIVIEDAAEAHGALYKDRRIGSLGNLATFSFYGNKIMTTGEGGMVTTNCPNLHQKLRLLRDHAMDPNRRYWHTEVGFNFRLTNLQAAIGCAQLERAQEIRAAKDRVFSQYETKLSQRNELTINPSRPWAAPSPWLVCIVQNTSSSEVSAKVVQDQLRLHSVDSRPYFIPIHHMPPYQDFKVVDQEGRPGAPISESLSLRGLNLPSSTKLESADIDRITELLCDIFDKNF